LKAQIFQEERTRMMLRQYHPRSAIAFKKMFSPRSNEEDEEQVVDQPGEMFRVQASACCLRVSNLKVEL